MTRWLSIFMLLAVGACAHTDQSHISLSLWPAAPEISLVAFTHDEEQALANSPLRLGEQDNLHLWHYTENTRNVENTEALHIRWRDAGWTGLRFASHTTADLQPLIDGYLNLTLTVLHADKQTGIELGLMGAAGMERRLSVDRQLQPLVGQGKQSLSLPLPCLVRGTDNAREVAVPLRWVLGGSGEFILHRAVIAPAPPAQALHLNCPPQASLATTPAVLDTSWARSWWLSRHKQKLAEAAGADPQVVFLGDSITQGWEGVGAPIFTEFFDRWSTLNLGFSGDRTENVLWRLEQGAVDAINPELVVLMIGTNNTGHRQDEPAWVAEGVAAILQSLTSRLPESKILLLAIFPRSAQADDLPRRNNVLINARLRNFADGERVFFHDLNSVFLDSQGRLLKALMPDELHPNEQGYRLLAQQLAPLIEQLLRLP